MIGHVDQAELAEFSKSIEEKYKYHLEAFTKEDVSEMFEHFFTDDVLWETHGYSLVKGKEGLRPLFEEIVKGHRVSLKSIQRFVNGNVGWDYVDYPVTPTDGRDPFVFHTMFMWVRISGEWFCNAAFAFPVDNS